MPLPSNGPWDLPFEGFEVLAVVFAFSIDVVAWDDKGTTATTRLHGRFRLSDADGRSHDLDAENQSWEELAVILALRHDKIMSATATETAQLLVEFQSGRSLSAAPNDAPYEHWEVTGPDFKLIALPGDDPPSVGLHDPW
jgi:hypothetical protein